MSRTPLVTLSEESGQFEIGEEAARVLANVNAPVVIFGLVGPYRTGKSSLLNMLLRLAGLLSRTGPDANGFAVGDTTQACTRGIHLFTRPAVNAEGQPIFFVDTEGLNSTERSAGASHDINIFLLTALIASVLAYNSKGTIDERAITDLSIVGEMARALTPGSAGSKRSRAASAASDEHADGVPADVADFMPDLLWIVRDFSLRMVDAQGNACTEQQYMETALEHRDGAPSDANDVRRVITTMFPHRHCITIRTPSAEEERVQQLNATPVTDLRIEFVKDVRRVLDFVKGPSVKPKVVIDPATGARAPLTGASFLQYLRTIVRAVNEGAAPPLKSNYAMLSETQCASAAAAARSLVAATLRKSASQTIHAEQLLAEAMALFAARSFGSHADVIRPQLEEELRSAIEDSLGAALRRSVEEWYSSCSAPGNEASDVFGSWRRSVAPLLPSHLQPILERALTLFGERDRAAQERSAEEVARASALRPQLEDLRRKCNDEAAAKREAAEALAAKTLDCEASERALKREHDHAVRLEADLKSMREEATRANAVAATAITLRGELDDRTAALDRSTRALESLDRDVAALSSSVESGKRALEAAETELARLRGAEERARRLDAQLNAARAENEETRAALGSCEVRATKAEEDCDRLRVEVVRARRERDEAVSTAELSRVATESQSLSVQLEARQEEARRLSARLDAITRRCRELEDAKFALERALGRSASSVTSAASSSSSSSANNPLARRT